MINRMRKRMDIKFQLHIFLKTILGLWFQQVFKDVAAAVYYGPASQTISPSVHDANLMFELLLGGVDVDQDNNIVLLDKEMASMRQGRAFLARINDNIPKTLLSMEQMLARLDGQRKPLSQTQFQSAVLSSVYSAHQARHQERAEEQLAWGAVLLRLTNVTVNDLRGQYLISYA